MQIPDPFRFIDPGPLIDGDLELVAPDAALIDDVLAACGHPPPAHEPPRAVAQLTRRSLLDFLSAAPRGRQPADHERGYLPQYTFWMRLHARPGYPTPPLRVAGVISLRIGYTPQVELYYGNVGYHVYPPARGNRYAERSCRLLLPLARRHGLRTLWITCNPDNLPSRRTCERLGMELLGIVPIPPDDPLYARGDREKCRYRLWL